MICLVLFFFFFFLSNIVGNDAVWNYFMNPQRYKQKKTQNIKKIKIISKKKCIQLSDISKLTIHLLKYIGLLGFINPKSRILLCLTLCSSTRAMLSSIISSS